MIYSSILNLIGQTPIVQLDRFKKELKSDLNLFAKLDYYNPGGSSKDRIAYAMILDAIEQGLIHKDSVIIESTSGNTGIGIAMVCSVLNIKCIICMPDTMSSERIKIIKAYGGDVVLTKGALGMDGCNKQASLLCKQVEHSISLKQFDNKINPLIHYKTTGKEIYEQMEGHVDVFIAGIGTGGTISGVSKYLKQQNPHIEIIGIEPMESPLLSKGISSCHKLQGMGTSFIPSVLDQHSYDQLIQVSYEESKMMAKLMGEKEGILVGISGGAVVYGASIISKDSKYKGKNIVLFLPDEGTRYLTTEFYE